MRKLLYGLVGLILLAACDIKKDGKRLPIYGNREPVTKTVDGKTVTDTIYQTIPSFKFVNQYGDTITNKSLDGNIYVADFFFTSCPNICPVMHRNMLDVYNTFKGDNGIKIISHTIDPKHDSVSVLKVHAEKLGIKDNNWWLLRGTKEETYQIAKDYMVTVKDGGVHDGYFILVDKQKRIRGSYLGTDAAEVKKMIADIKILQAEPDQTIAQ